MKVITNGKDKVYTTTCGKCNSDLVYTDADVFYTIEECKGGLRETVSHLFKPDEHYINVYLQNFRCVKCPVCGNIIKSFYFDNLSDIKTIRWERVE